MRMITATVMSVMLISGGLAFARDGEERGIRLYGTLAAEALAGVGYGDFGANGFETELRLVLEAEEDDLSFRAEGGYVLAYGISSPSSAAFEGGLVPVPDEDSLPPETDLHRDFFVDQAWARAVLGDFDFKAGIVPVAWGSAYLYNPTARTSELAFPGEDMDRIRGKPGALLAVALPAGFGIEAYALALGRMSDGVPESRELSPGGIPHGFRVFRRSDRLDASVAWIRERIDGDSDAASFVGLDATLVAGPFSLYAETAIPVGAAARGTELSAGFAWDVASRNATVRAEYIRLGRGSANGAYDPARLLSGECVLLARDYLYVGAEKEDGENASWKIEAGALVNLDDRSVALLGKASWKPRAALELSAFARYFSAALSESGSPAEFGKAIQVGPGIEFDPYRSAAGLSAAWSF